MNTSDWMNIFGVSYTLIVASFFWFIRPWLAENGHRLAHYWITNMAIGSWIAVPGLIMETFERKPAADLALILSLPVLAGVFVTTVRNFVSYALSKVTWSGRKDDGHIRGAALQDERSVARHFKRAVSRFSVGSIPVPVDLETRGFLLAGAPGTGKSQTLTHALDALRADGATAVIADPSGIYTSRFFNPDGNDVVINPFDQRSTNWSPLSEIETIADIPALAKSLIPDQEGNGAEWSGYAQTFVEAILEHCFLHGLGNAELFRLLVVADIPELREVCAGTPAQQLVAEGNERMFGSVRAIASSSSKFIQYLDPEADAANGFSIRKYLHAGAPGYLFLSYQQQHRDALKSMIACCVDVAARAVLSLTPSSDRRVIFALDELPLLGKVQSIVDLATNGRKHGAMVFAGLQTISQLREAYGRDTAQTLLACLGSWLVLRVTDGETAEYMSRHLGEEEKTRIIESGGKSYQAMQIGGGRSENWQQQIVKDRVILPSELQALPDLRGIFNLAGPTPAAVVEIKLAAERKVADGFIPAPPRARSKNKVARQEQMASTEEKGVEASAELDLL